MWGFMALISSDHEVDVVKADRGGRVTIRKAKKKALELNLPLLLPQQLKGTPPSSTLGIRVLLFSNLQEGNPFLLIPRDPHGI